MKMYNIIIIDDVLDGITVTEDLVYSDVKGKTLPASLDRRIIYDSLINAIKQEIEPLAAVTVKFFGNATLQEKIEKHAKTSTCDLIIIDEELSQMFTNSRTDDGEHDSIALTKDVFDMLSRLNGGFYAKYRKLPPVIRVTGRHSDETLTAKSFVGLHRKLGAMLNDDFKCGYTPTYFFNVLVRNISEGEYTLTGDGLKFKNEAIHKMTSFYEYRISATQPSALLTYVNDNEKKGIVEALTSNGFNKNTSAPDRFFTNTIQNIIFEKWERVINEHCLAVYLLSAGPGASAFLKKTLSFLITQKKYPISIGCIVCSGVAFAAVDLKGTNVVISKALRDADFERYESGKTLPSGAEVLINNDLKNTFLEKAKSISDVKADDVVVASADKLYKSTEAKEELTLRYPTANVGEMEARGLIHVTFGADALVKYGIMIKGISDDGDENKNDEKQCSTAKMAADVILKTISDDSFIKTYLFSSHEKTHEG